MTWNDTAIARSKIEKKLSFVFSSLLARWILYINFSIIKYRCRV